jgi:hypothetical protein
LHCLVRYTVIVASNSQLAVVGYNGTIITSYDGSAWEIQQTGSSQSGPWYSLYDVASPGDYFLAVGAGGNVLTSSQ